MTLCIQNIRRDPKKEINKKKVQGVGKEHTRTGPERYAAPRGMQRQSFEFRPHGIYDGHQGARELERAPFYFYGVGSINR